MSMTLATIVTDAIVTLVSSLQSNSISDPGMTALTRSLRTNQCLQSLKLVVK